MQHGAYIHARFSTSNQNEASIETQVEKCSEWCRNNNIPVLDIFPDYAISGMKESRPQYDRMMLQLSQGGADTVVIYDQSRMFRDMILWFQFRNTLEQMGVRVVSVTQPNVGGDLRDPANFLNEGVTALFNQMWVLQTKQKTLEGVRHRAKSGKHTGGIPALGYRVENEYLVIDQAEAETVRLIFSMYAAGQTYGTIISELNNRGLKTKRGKPFGRNSLHDLLKNEKYVGRAYFGVRKPSANGTRNSHAKRPENCIEISCPAIIDQETFDAVQQRLKENQKSTGRTVREVDQPLKGKVFCGDCGSAMTIAYSYSSKSQTRYTYYKCAGKKRGLACDAKQIRKDELEDTVYEAVRAQLGSASARTKLIEILRQQRDRIQEEAAPQINILKAELDDVSKQLDNAVEAILHGLTSQAVIQKVESLEKDKTALEQKYQAYRDMVMHSNMDDSKIEELLSCIIDGTAGDPYGILSIVVRVEVYPDTLKIWTIIDDDPDPEKQHEDLTKHNIAEVVPIDPVWTSDAEMRIIVGTASGVPEPKNYVLGFFFAYDRGDYGHPVIVVGMKIKKKA